MDVSPSLFEPFFKITYFCLLMYGLFQLTVKMSISLLYLRIFTEPGWTRRLIYVVIAFLCITNVLSLFLVSFSCTPVARGWNPSIPGTCLNLKGITIASTVTSAFVDLCLILIVLPRVLHLNLPRGQKISVLIIVNLGWIVIVGGILRTVNLLALTKATMPDFTWTTLNFAIWTSLECSIALTCASASALRPLLQKISPCWWTGMINKHSQKSQSTGGWSGQRSHAAEGWNGQRSLATEEWNSQISPATEEWNSQSIGYKMKVEQSEGRSDGLEDMERGNVGDSQRK
jgi:hypothetical protein